MDHAPLSAQVNLLERDSDALALTGRKDKLLQLTGLADGIDGESVIDGVWDSADGIHVSISSVLVDALKARSVARKLVAEKPISVWLPSCEAEGDDAHLGGDHPDFYPWVLRTSKTARLDAQDPIGAPFAVQRSRIASTFTDRLSLRSSDPFGRSWTDSQGTVLARSEAWGPGEGNRDHGSGGVRLVCSHRLLKSALRTFDADLILLIKLTRYQAGYGRESSKFSHTVAVVRIRKDDLRREYFRGRINHIESSRP